ASPAQVPPWRRSRPGIRRLVALWGQLAGAGSSPSRTVRICLFIQHCLNWTLDWAESPPTLVAGDGGSRVAAALSSLVEPRDPAVHSRVLSQLAWRSREGDASILDRF